MCAFLQNLSLYGTGIAYVITTSTCMRAIQKSNCYHREGHDAPCSYGDTYFMLLFGAVQVVMSHIPNFHNMAWLSVVAAIMSFTYSFIGFGLGFAQVIENGTIKGSITGVPAASVADKLWLVFQSLGEIAFAYPYTIILLEIQDTLKSPPSENKTMKMASMIAIFVTTFFYLFRDCFGYAAFGNNTPGNLLTGFGFFEPCWLIDFANACIVLHLHVTFTCVPWILGDCVLRMNPLESAGELLVSAGNGDCVLHMNPLASKGNPFLNLPSYDKLPTPVNGAYFLIATVLVFGGSWACCMFSKKRRPDGISYQDLEMGLPESMAATEEETAEGWDQGWDSDWDEDKAVKSPMGRRNVPKISANGLTA
ncbi:Amino acid permease 1 [Hibiscus syriacus]|uniref:Amino acid permease 1 n=1 Tax=Hibiscus syriacus TaxID=106335 RepID=A0A6A3AX07_HIBSY|nr:Amino acid permease 1 [Hibiscus syriacus]